MTRLPTTDDDPAAAALRVRLAPLEPDDDDLRVLLVLDPALQAIDALLTSIDVDYVP